MRIKTTPSTEYAIREVKQPYVLDSEVKVLGQGPREYDLAYCIVGEAPGYDEVQRRQPFVGKSGDKLNMGLARAGINRLKCWVTNAITVRPPQNKIKSDEGREAIEAEREEFWQEVAYIVRERGVRIFLALGNTAIQMLNIPGVISKVRGSVVAMNLENRAPVAEGQADFFVVPTYHPAYILRNGFYSRNEMNVSLYQIWYMDIEKAKQLHQDNHTLRRRNFNWDPTVEDVSVFVADAIRTQALVALDLETDGLDPRKDNIVCIGLAMHDSGGISIRLRDARNTFHYEPSLIEWIFFEIQKLLDEAWGFVLQNAKYDLKWLLMKGFKFDWSKLKHDTMVMAHTISPELPLNLGFISSIYARTAYWKENTNWEEGSIYQRDPQELGEYNIQDCTVLHECLPGMLQELNSIGASGLYHNEALPMIKPVTQMEINGTPWDETTKKKIGTRIKDELPELEQRMRKVANLPDEFEFKASHLMVALFKTVPSLLSRAPAELEACKNKNTKKYKTAYDKVQVLQKTPKGIWDYSERVFKPSTTESGTISVNEESRTRLMGAALRRRQYLEGIKHPTKQHTMELADIEKLLTFLSLYNRHAGLTKLMTTYMKYKAGSDKRIHPNWKNAGTATGRLSCTSPNLMNLPKPNGDEDDVGGDFRECVKAPEDFKLVTPDYSMLEVGTVAYESGDPNLVEIFEHKLNQHDINTKILFGIDEKHPQWKVGRKAAKIFQFGMLNYGGSERSIYNKVREAAPELGLTFEAFQQAGRNYFKVNHVYSKWRDEIQEQGITTRKVTSAFGRVRVFYGPTYDVKKEALNFPCQSAAASIINRATIRIDNRMEQEFPQCELILQIHDQLVFLVPDEQVAEFSQFVCQEMERPVEIYGTLRTFPVDIEVGQDLKNLQSLESYLKQTS